MMEMTEFCGKPSLVSQCLIEHLGTGVAPGARQKNRIKAAANENQLIPTVFSEAGIPSTGIQAFFNMPESAGADLKSQNCCLLSSF
jgi:hypothetical protein